MTSARALVRGVAEAAIVRSGLATLASTAAPGPGGGACLSQHRPHRRASFRRLESSFASTAVRNAPGSHRVSGVESYRSTHCSRDRPSRMSAGSRSRSTMRIIGALTAGLEELRRRSMPATVFRRARPARARHLVGPPWRRRVAASFPTTRGSHAIEDLRGDRDSRAVEWFAARGGKEHAAGCVATNRNRIGAGDRRRRTGHHHRRAFVVPPESECTVRRRARGTSWRRRSLGSGAVCDYHSLVDLPVWTGNTGRRARSGAGTTSRGLPG